MNDPQKPNTYNSADEFSNGIRNPRNKVVIVGLFILGGTGILICMFVLFAVGLSVFENGIEEVIPALFLVILVLSVGFIYTSVLYNSTKNYLKNKSKKM